MEEKKQFGVTKPATSEELLDIIRDMQRTIGGGLGDIREQDHRDDKDR